jgi:hypothetical protein
MSERAAVRRVGRAAPGARFRPRQPKVIKMINIAHPPLDHLRYWDVGRDQGVRGATRGQSQHSLRSAFSL